MRCVSVSSEAGNDDADGEGLVIDHVLVMRGLRCRCGVSPLVQRLAMMMLIVRVSLPGGYDDVVGDVVLYQHSYGVVVNARKDIDSS